MRCIHLSMLGFFLTQHIVSFQSDSSVTITCANGKWTKQVSCEPVDCGLPDKYHVHPAQFIFPEGTTYGKRSTFHCREPAQLVGESQRWREGVCISQNEDDLSDLSGPPVHEWFPQEYLYALHTNPTELANIATWKTPFQLNQSANTPLCL